MNAQPKSRRLEPLLPICTGQARRSASRPSMLGLLRHTHGNPRHARKNRPAGRDRGLFKRGQSL